MAQPKKTGLKGPTPEFLAQAGKGRPKGVPNKATTAIKDMVVAALNGAHPDGGLAYLIEQAGKNPVAFLSLVGKVIPLQVTGEGGGPVQTVTRIELVAPPSKGGKIDIVLGTPE